MLAVILTKSFRCLCFTLKCTYPYFSVYLNCVFGTACVWTAYKLSAVKGAFSKGTKETRRHWTYAKWKQSSYSSQLRGSRSSEQHPSDAKCDAVFWCLWFTHVLATGGKIAKRKKKKKRKWGIQSENYVSSQQEVPHNEC